MKRISYSILACTAALVIASAAFATPAPNSAVLNLRTFNDCPLSTLTPINGYPATISIEDVMAPACVGFANLHGWSFSENGATPSLFVNGSNFEYCAIFRIEGPGQGEGGLRFSPWYGQLVDGRFMANATTGEIACFGGAIPFYTFTGNFGITYVKGTDIYMRITYIAHSNTIADPATIQYRVIHTSGTYDSPIIPFGEQNALENPPHGVYGCLHDAMVGGYFQARANTGVGLKAIWNEICYTNLDVVPTESSTWGRIKTLYR
jgi:hypothetical protein